MVTLVGAAARVPLRPFDTTSKLVIFARPMLLLGAASIRMLRVEVLSVVTTYEAEVRIFICAFVSGSIRVTWYVRGTLAAISGQVRVTCSPGLPERTVRFQ